MNFADTVYNVWDLKPQWDHKDTEHGNIDVAIAKAYGGNVTSNLSGTIRTRNMGILTWRSRKPMA